MAYYEDIITDSNGKVKCVLCKVYIPDNDTVIEDHLNNSDHVDLYIQRLMLKNNIQRHNNDIHCVVCNEVFHLESILEHIYGKNHMNNMESIKVLVEKDGGFLQLPKIITNRRSDVYCLVCDRCVDLQLQAVKDHLMSPKHRRGRAIAVQPLNGIFSIEGSSDDLWCKICQVYFENYVETIFEHVDDDPEHAKKLGKILKLIDGQNINIEKFLYDPKEDKGVCMKCGIEVPCNVDNLCSHIKGKKHINS